MESALFDLLNKRSPSRAISPEPVEEDKLRSVLEAAHLSASCMNFQPWRFLVLTEPESLEKGRAALTQGNYWARSAPVLLVGFSRPELDATPPDGREYYLFDLGMAVQNILLRATELDLVARPMAGFVPSKLHEAFEIGEEYTVMVVIALGYEGDMETLKEKHKKVSTAPRTRNPLEEHFFFNQPYKEPPCLFH